VLGQVRGEALPLLVGKQSLCFRDMIGSFRRSFQLTAADYANTGFATVSSRKSRLATKAAGHGRNQYRA
jgi:hypothetical protein